MSRKMKLTEKHLRRFYRLLSVPMIDFDCGRLCAPSNEGIPICCDNDSVVPILFREEFKLQKAKGRFWKKMPVKTKADREFVKDSYSYYVFALCPGHENCLRSRRSLNCMTYPFEPHIDRKGRVVGLVYKDEGDEECPLVRRSWKIYNPVYISNSVLFWQELTDLVPGEKELYLSESRKRERKAKRMRKRIRIFTAEKGKVTEKLNKI
jgi:hypothetical protein